MPQREQCSHPRHIRKRQKCMELTQLALLDLLAVRARSALSISWLVRRISRKFAQRKLTILTTFTDKRAQLEGQVSMELRAVQRRSLTDNSATTSKHLENTTRLCSLKLDLRPQPIAGAKIWSRVQRLAEHPNLRRNCSR